MLIELERIKRPSWAVYSIAQMLCMYVDIFKTDRSLPLDIDQVTSWLDL